MALGIIALGHAGGVPGPYMDMVGNHGNTNFALVPDITDDIIEDAMDFSRTGDRWDQISSILGATPYWLIDCGPETALRLCGVGGQPPVAKNCKGIFLTHGHDDHSGGLKSFAYRCKFIEKTHPWLYYPRALGPVLESQLVEFSFLKTTSDGSGPNDFYRMWPLGVGKIDDWGDFEISQFLVNHNCFDGKGNPFPAVGYKVTTHGGKTIVFSGDTAFPIPLEITTSADFVIHDVQFYNDGSKNDHVHCPYAVLRDALPLDQRKKVWLTHTGHDLPPEAKTDGFAGLFRQGRVLVLD